MKQDPTEAKLTKALRLAVFEIENQKGRPNPLDLVGFYAKDLEQHQINDASTKALGGPVGASRLTHEQLIVELVERLEKELDRGRCMTRAMILII